MIAAFFPWTVWVSVCVCVLWLQTNNQRWTGELYNYLWGVRPRTCIPIRCKIRSSSFLNTLLSLCFCMQYYLVAGCIMSLIKKNYPWIRDFFREKLMMLIQQSLVDQGKEWKWCIEWAFFACNVINSAFTRLRGCWVGTSQQHISFEIVTFWGVPSWRIRCRLFEMPTSKPNCSNRHHDDTTGANIYL